jgi:hypothetical protein
LNCHAFSNRTDITDGTIVLDNSGDQWQYNSKLNIWSCIGSFQTIPVVTSTNDGLISPAIYSRINAISEAVANGLKFDALKIYPHTLGYYYLFQSSNHTITFEPESANDLRIEISRPRLLSLLSQLKCPGAQGEVGEQGATGDSGVAGKAEAKHIAVVEGSTLTIDAIVGSTIDTPISLRLFRNDSSESSLTIWQPINGDDFIIIYSEFELSIGSFLNYDRVGSILYGELISNEWSSDTWYYKANEIGRKGTQGVDGSGFFDVVENSLVDDTLNATEAIITLRYNNPQPDIYFFSDTLFSKNCVSKLAISHTCSTTNVDDLSTVVDLSLAAVRSTTETCKNITRFQFIEKQTTAPTLEFVEWTPIEACWTQHQANQFNWKDFTPASIVAWREANSSTNRDTRYPWSIIEPQFPGQRCCQEDFFFCSNVNDVAGGCPVLLIEPFVPPTTELCCPCDCPSYLDNSLEINLPYNADSSVDPTCVGFDCVIDGTLQHYDITINVPSTNNGSITTNITLSTIFNSICDEARAISSASCPEYPDTSTCPVSWSAVCSNSNVPGGKKYSTIGSALTFAYSGPSGVALEFGIDINLAGTSCCLGYSVLACAIGPSTRPTTTPAPSTTPSPTLGPTPTPPTTISPYPTTTPAPSTSYTPPITTQKPTTTPGPTTSEAPPEVICPGKCTWYLSAGGGTWSKATNPCTPGCYCPTPTSSTPRAPYGGGYIAYTRCKPGSGPEPSPSPSPEPPGSPSPSPSPAGVCSYTITAQIDWATQTDFDLYGKRGSEAACYFGSPIVGGHHASGGLTLNNDVYPSCDVGPPDPPEIISGTYAVGHTFQFWYNRWSEDGAAGCIDGDVTSQSIVVQNTGTGNITVNGINLTPGSFAAFGSSITFDMRRHDVPDGSGTPIVVACA